VISPGIDLRMMEVLDRASSMELFQLSAVIERLLGDPRRIVAIRKDMHLGQTVRFLDWRDGQMRTGKVVALKDTQLTLHEDGSRREWKLPYAAIEPPTPNPAAKVVNPAPPTAPTANRNDFRCGEKVAFEDKHLQTVVGTIVRINERTATIDPGDGTKWRVGFPLLRHVHDI
jgi:predicted RecA/RadA family phage recombinase